MKNRKTGVYIFMQREWARKVGMPLCRALRDSGYRLAASSLKQTTDRYLRSQKEIEFEVLTSQDAIIENPAAFLGDDHIEMSEVCEGLEVDSVWPFVVGKRTHSKSYADRFYYGYRQHIKDEEIVLYVKAVYKSFRDMFDLFKPSVVVMPNYASLQHIFLNRMALARGIRTIVIQDAKVQGIYMPVYKYDETISPLLDRITELENGAKSENEKRAEKYIAEFRKEFKAPTYVDIDKKKDADSIFEKIKDHARPWYYSLKWFFDKSRYDNYLKNIGPSIDFRPPRIILRDHFSYNRNKKFAEDLDYYPLEKTGRSVFFPLQFQPEHSIDIIAPYHANQIETARQVAMSLPDDYTLVVKEHPAMVGYRRPAYLEKLARTPNVKLIDYRIRIDQVLKKCDAIVSAYSTAIAEAAFYGIPAILLSTVGTFEALPNTILHTEMSTFSEAIKKGLALDTKSEEYERKLINFVASAFDVGYGIDYHSIWYKDSTEGLGTLVEIHLEEIKKAVAQTGDLGGSNGSIKTT